MNGFPVCMAKTQKSFRRTRKKWAGQEGFKINIREFEAAAEQGLWWPLWVKWCVPGLPVIPASEGMDIDNEGNITGLS